MNNPSNLSNAQRAITPGPDFNKGINFRMTAERRTKKNKRYQKNKGEQS
jgi:hypothetical protein